MNNEIELNNKEELMVNDEATVFPAKPIEKDNKQSIITSIGSLVLFVAVFYLFFDWKITEILVLAGIILIHELGHYLAMKIYGYKDLGILFIPVLGAIATGSKDHYSRKESIIVSLAGPIPGIFIGLVLYYFGLSGGNEFLIKTSNIFIFLNLFNLLPFMPLDGGHVIKSLFFESNHMITFIFTLLSIVSFGYFAIATETYFFLIIPVMLFLQLNRLAEVRKVIKSVRAKGIQLNRGYDELSDEDYWMIRDEIGAHMKYFNKFITPKKHVYSDNENKVIKQVIEILQKKPIDDLGLWGKTIITLVWVMSFIIPVVVVAAYYLGLGLW